MGLDYLPFTLLGVFRLQWVNTESKYLLISVLNIGIPAFHERSGEVKFYTINLVPAKYQDVFLYGAAIGFEFS